MRTICPLVIEQRFLFFRVSPHLCVSSSLVFFWNTKNTQKVERHCFYVVVRQYFLIVRIFSFKFLCWKYEPIFFFLTKHYYRKSKLSISSTLGENYDTGKRTFHWLLSGRTCGGIGRFDMMTKYFKYIFDTKGQWDTHTSPTPQSTISHLTHSD